MNGVDEASKRVFLSLSVERRQAIRYGGTVWNCANPSATLMKRIRSGNAEGRATTKEVAILLRGEAFRAGRNKEHRSDRPTETLVTNLASIQTYLVAPLQKQGYDVLIFADIMGDAAREEETRLILEIVFGSAIREARVKQWLSGRDQTSSVVSSVDTLYHMLTMREKKLTVAGAYVLRVDTKLLQLGMSDWPLDKLCFQWKTKWAASERSVNDVLFYVPCSLFDEFRTALETPQAPDNLHWLSECRNCPQRGT